MPTPTPLKLPKTTDEWVESDQLLTQVLPAVVRCSSVEHKSRVVGELTYSLLRERFGCRPLPRAGKRHQGQKRQHNRALKKVTILKNEARQALRQAKRSNREKEEIHCHSGKFLSLLREHSQLKRASDCKGKELDDKEVRKQCSENFWRFTRELLDGDAVSNILLPFTLKQLRNSFQSSSPHSHMSSHSQLGCLQQSIQNMRCPILTPSRGRSC